MVTTRSQKPRETLYQIPNEIFDEILSYLWSAPNVHPSHPDWKKPQVLGNLRLSSRFFRRTTENAFLRRNFHRLHIALETRFPGPATIPGDLDRLRDIITDPYYSSRATPVNILSYVREIRFEEPNTAMSLLDLTNYNGTLASILNGCNNLERVEIFALHQSGAPIARLTTLLSTTPVHTLRSILMSRGTYTALLIESLFQRHAPSLQEFMVDRVSVPGGNLERLVQIWRDSPLLSTVWVAFIFSEQPQLVGGLGAALPPLECYMSSSPAHTRAFTNPAAGNQVETYNISPAGVPTGMKGLFGRQLGMNRVLQLRGSNLFDPTLTVDVLRSNGTLR